MFNRIPQTEGSATGDDRKASAHKSYGVKRAIKWILANYEVGPYDRSTREEVVRERVEEMWGETTDIRTASTSTRAGRPMDVVSDISYCSGNIEGD